MTQYLGLAELNAIQAGTVLKACVSVKHIPQSAY